MKACGLIVEYNPFHNGHRYHAELSRKRTEADCLVAVMSGNFLQRGEPAIIDKIHRTKAALQNGVDLVVELPYAYALQASDYFALGAIQTLAALQVDAICFGSELGEIQPFIQTYEAMKANEKQFNHFIQDYMDQGESYPKAYELAAQQLEIDLLQQAPNNILGNSYVKVVKDLRLPIELATIQRIQNHYHDVTLTKHIASATSIRKAMIEHGITDNVSQTIPSTSLQQMRTYYSLANTWHQWELYFPFLRYRVETASIEELQMIQGMDEGIEYRLKKTIPFCHTFHDLMDKLRTKRYTSVRIQRLLTNILTNTSKQAIKEIHALNHMPYVRILGFNAAGKTYLGQVKKQMDLPLVSSLSKANSSLLALEEKVSDTYYTPLAPSIAENLRKAELQLPIQV